MNATQKTWHLELTENELIAVARACTDYQEKLIAQGWLTAEEAQTMALLNALDDKYPDEEWFSEEVRA